MTATVEPTDLKVRIYEAPSKIVVLDDQRIAVDGPVSGPASVDAAALAAAGLIGTPPTVANPSVNAQVLMLDGGRVQRYSIVDAVGRDNQWYLGPFSSAPAASALGLPITPGNTYFDTSTLQMYVYTGVTYGWQVQAQLLPANLKTYTWYCATPQQLFPDRSINPRDVHGQLISFELSAADDVTVYLNGAKLVGNVDYFLQPDITIMVAEPVCADSILEIRVAKRIELNFQVSAVLIRTSSWVFDGSQTRFPLYDLSGQRITAASAANCIVSVNSFLLDPTIDFSIIDGNLVVAEPLPAGATVWMQVGLPITPSVFDNAVEIGGGGILEIQVGEPLLFQGLAPVIVVSDTTPTQLPGGLVPVSSAPTPTAALHGKLCMLSRTGVTDQVLVCVKGADETYYWQPLIYMAV